MSRVLLINPSYYGSYGSAKARIVNPIHPTLGLATIAGAALERGHDVEILDLCSKTYDFREIDAKVRSFSPDVVGITATTPLMNQLRDISVLVKDISENISVIAGGPHPSALPVETIRESRVDAVFVGEGDFSFAEYCDGMAPGDIKGIYHVANGEPVFTGWRPLIESLDDLPMPAWHLYDLDQYREMSRILARRTPITMAEFSRGCVFRCDFCASKVQMGLGYRKKSPARCAEEVKLMHRLGYREFRLADDIFTSDQKWAGAVSDAIAAADVDIIWSAANGIRVESADETVFQKMRAAKCYQVAFGFESGNDRVLKEFGKGGKASIEEGKRAVRLANRAGLDTVGFFMLGLSPDTEDSMRDTVEFARQLPLAALKFGTAIAFPGSSMFNAGVRNGSVLSYNWDDYFIYTEENLYTHPRLAAGTVFRMTKHAYRRAVLFNIRFWLRRFVRGLKTGDFFWDVYYFVQFALLPATSKTIRAKYYAEDRWPAWNFTAHPPAPAAYQVVGKSDVRAVA